MSSFLMLWMEFCHKCPLERTTNNNKTVCEHEYDVWGLIVVIKTRVSFVLNLLLFPLEDLLFGLTVTSRSGGLTSCSRQCSPRGPHYSRFWAKSQRRTGHKHHLLMTEVTLCLWKVRPLHISLFNEADSDSCCPSPTAIFHQRGEETNSQLVNSMFHKCNRPFIIPARAQCPARCHVANDSKAFKIYF